MQQISNFNDLNLEDFNKLAQNLSARAKVGDIYLLYGDLGAGKTTFVQTFVSSLGVVREEITSPTFNLVHIYDSKICKIWHYDLYRLTSIDEIYELGLDDAFMYGITIIEWPDIAEKILPKCVIKIKITACQNIKLRNVSIQR